MIRSNEEVLRFFEDFEEILIDFYLDYFSTSFLKSWQFTSHSSRNFHDNDTETSDWRYNSFEYDDSQSVNHFVILYEYKFAVDSDESNLSHFDYFINIKTILRYQTWNSERVRFLTRSCLTTRPVRRSSVWHSTDYWRVTYLFHVKEIRNETILSRTATK